MSNAVGIFIDDEGLASIGPIPLSSARDFEPAQSVDEALTRARSMLSGSPAGPADAGQPMEQGMLEAISAGLQPQARAAATQTNPLLRADEILERAHQAVDGPNRRIRR